MSEGNLPRLVRSFLDEELLLGTEIAGVAQANLVMYGFDPSRFDAAAVGQALVDVGRQLSARLAGVTGPVTFYAWYDEQAGQLRCSVTCTEVTALPFTGPFRPVDDPGPVLDRMAASSNPGTVLEEERREGPGADAEQAGGYWFPVFAVKVAGG